MKYLFNPATDEFESLSPTLKDRFNLKDQMADASSATQMAIDESLEAFKVYQNSGGKLSYKDFIAAGNEGVSRFFKDGGRVDFELGGGVIQGEKVGDRENFADISLGGQKTSALQEKVTSAARNNLDSFVEKWILNNTGDYNATEIDKWKNDLEIAVTEEIAKNPKKYDTGNFKFNKLITTEGGTFPNVQSTRKRSGFKVYDMSYAVDKTDRLAPLFNKIFYKGQLLNNKTLKKDVENFMDFIIKNKNYVKGQTTKETGRQNIETRKQLSKPEVIAVLDGLNSKQKNEVLGELFKNKYNAFNKKLNQDGLRYKETLKNLEKKVGVKPGSTFQAMTKERLAVQKIIGLEGGLAPSVEHIYGLAVVKDSNDKNLIKSALNAITLKPRQLNVEKGFGVTSFDQQRIKLVQDFEKANLNQKNEIRTKLNELSAANDAGLKFTIGKDGSLNTQVTRSSQSVYKRIKNYLTDITKNKQLFGEAMKKGSDQTKQILKDVKKGSYDSLKKLKPQIDKINTTLMKALGPGTTGRRAAEAVPGVLGKGVDAAVLAPADLFMSLTAGYSIPESVGIAATNFLKGPAAKVVPATIDAYDRQKQFEPVFNLSGGEETKFGKKIREGVGEAIEKIKERFGDDAIGTADETPESEATGRRRMFEEANERFGDINELEIADIDNQFMAAMGGRVGFENGSPDPFVDQALASLNSSSVAEQFIKDNTPSLKDEIYGEDGERNLIQTFNTMFADPEAYPYYAQELASGGANIPELAVRFPTALAYLFGKTSLATTTGDLSQISMEDFKKAIEIMDPKYTRFVKDKIGFTDMLEKSRAERTGPQKRTGGILEFGAEAVGPATPYFLIKTFPRIAKELRNLTGSAAAVDKINKEIENKMATQGVDQTRRDILLATGAGGAMALLKYLGLDNLIKTTKVAKAAPEIMTTGGTPKYFFDFVNLIKTKGDDVTDKASTLERQKVYNYEGYQLTEDMTTGRMTINKETEGGASYYIGDGEYDTVDGIIRKEEINYDPPETILDDTGKPKKVPDMYEESTLKPDYDGGDGDVEGGLDSIDDILELLSKDGKTYSKEELLKMGVDADALGNYPTGAGSIPEGRVGEANPFKPKKAGGGIMKLAGDDSGPPPKSGPTPHGLPYVAKNVRPIKERK